MLRYDIAVVGIIIAAITLIIFGICFYFGGINEKNEESN